MRRAPPGADEASRASGRNTAIGKRQGRVDRADVATGMSAPRKVKFNIEMWLSLVERYVRDVEAAGSNPVISTKKGKGSLLPFPFFVEIHRFRTSQIACDLTARARGERWNCARKWRTQRFVNPVISTKKGKGSLLPFPFL